MGRHKLFNYEPKLVRDTIRSAKEKSLEMHQNEKDLIAILQKIDRHRFFVRLGYKSLRTFCIDWLGFTRIQAQRIVTETRRAPTTFDIGQEVYREPRDYRRRN